MEKMSKEIFLEDLQDPSGRLPWRVIEAGDWDRDRHPALDLEPDLDQAIIKQEGKLRRALKELGDDDVIYSRDGRLFRWATYDDPLLWHRCNCPTARKDQRDCLYQLFENIADPGDVFCTHCGFLPKERVGREREGLGRKGQRQALSL